jgi:hypothetical protein
MEEAEVEWIHLGQGMVQWRAYLKISMLRFHKKQEIS